MEQNPVMNMYYLSILVLFTLLSFSSAAMSRDCRSVNPPRVQLSTGCVEGTIMTAISGRPIYSFLGIPYAAPPVGLLRFRAPQPPVSWSGILSATETPPACIQPHMDLPNTHSNISEDCLKLFVYTPFLKPPRDQTMPVIVYVHGGAFYLSNGSPSIYGPQFLLTRDVVLVSVNYRLGVFGYLNMNISEAQGNAALKDKIAALKWVQKEITEFGGNPKSVTLAGYSSGAAEVSMLYISPLSKGLFHRAMAGAGGAACFWAFLPSTKNLGLELAASLGCPTHSPQAVVSCLRDMDGISLAQKQLIFNTTMFGVENPFLPTIEYDWGEEVCLPDTPEKLLANCENRGPLLTSTNNGEGVMFAVKYEDHILELLRKFESDLPLLLPDYMRRGSPEGLQEACREIHEFYLGNRSSYTRTDVLNAYVQFTGDVMDAVCTVNNAVQFSRRITVYMYYFTFVGESQKADYQMKDYDVNVNGATHCAELAYVFHGFTSLQNETAYPKERAMIERMVTLLTNFATFGNPTPPHNSLDITWRPMEKGFTRHLVIGETMEMAEYPVIEYRVKFWDHVLTLLFPTESGLIPVSSNHIIAIIFLSLLLIFMLICCVFINMRGKHKSYVNI